MNRERYIRVTPDGIDRRTVSRVTVVQQPAHGGEHEIELRLLNEIALLTVPEARRLARLIVVAVDGRAWPDGSFQA